jgi:acetyl-CoA C-acetyltransferase
MGGAVWILGGYQSEFLWPSMFAQVADEYDRRYGLDDACAPQPQRG